MAHFTIRFNFLKPEEEVIEANTARDAVSLYFLTRGDCCVRSDNFGRTVTATQHETQEQTFWMCSSHKGGQILQTNQQGDVVGDIPTVNEILRRHNLPEVVDTGSNVPVVIAVNRELIKWAETATVKAVLDDFTCQTCAALNGKNLGDVLRLGYSGPPFHQGDDERGPCRCSIWGTSPAGILLKLKTITG